MINEVKQLIEIMNNKELYHLYTLYDTKNTSKHKETCLKNKLNRKNKKK